MVKGRLMPYANWTTHSHTPNLEMLSHLKMKGENRLILEADKTTNHYFIEADEHEELRQAFTFFKVKLSQ